MNMIEQVRIETGDKKKVLWISGPGKILVKTGKIVINGATYNEGEEIIVHKDRSFTFILDKNTTAHISVRDEKAVREASLQEQKILLEWMTIAEKIVDECRKKKCTVTIVGGVDSGKTTFAVMFSNMSVEKGLETVFIDADLGQSTVGLPGFIALKRYKGKTLWPRSESADKYIFVGRVSPTGVEEKTIHALTKIMEEKAVADSTLRVIDTDGWIEGYEAVDYKQKILFETKSTHVVLIYSSEYEPYLRAIKRIVPKQTCVYEIETPPNKILRTRTERTLLREEKLKQYFKNLPIRQFSLDSLFVTGTILLGYGEPLSENELREETKRLRCNVIYAEKLGDKKVVLTNRRCTKKNSEDTLLISSEDLENRVAGIIAEESHTTYPGLIIGARENKGLLIKTEYGICSCRTFNRSPNAFYLPLFRKNSSG
jgi:polynucleotide 5'-hydroxyl-kinase GRC3/NOL9